MLNTIHKQLHQILVVKSSITQRERSFAFLIFAILAVAFIFFQVVTAWLHQLDTAFLMENLATIKNTGIPSTYLGQSIYDAFNPNIFILNAENLCQAKLMPSGIGAANILDTHAYFILYPLAILTWFFPPHVILAVANGLSFVSFIFILYWVIRKQGTPIIGAIVFCFLTMAHPVWSHASLGNFYADHFFMPLGLLYASRLYEIKFQQSKITLNYLLLTLLVGLLAVITTERGAIMIALFTIAYLVLYKNSITERTTKIFLTVFSISILIYILLYLKLLYVRQPGTGNLYSLLHGIPYFLEQIKEPLYAAKVHEFIVINVILFGIFSLFDWRLALIAFAALLPNILTTMGGAEKVGWATHYHSMYFPFLSLASAMGFSRLWRYLGLIKYRLILIGIILALIPTISNYSTGYRDQSGAVKRIYDFYANGSGSHEIQMADRLEKIAAAVPTGSRVTTPEGFMTALYLDRTIYYYPIGIDIADYAVLNKVINPDGTFYYAGVFSYIAGETQKADICLTERLRKIGFNVDQPKLLLGNIAVLERQKK